MALRGSRATASPDHCTDADIDNGRTVSISDNEPLQHRLRKLAKTHAGRARLRERVSVEHKLAHIGYRQRRRARYRGVRAAPGPALHAGSVVLLPIGSQH